MIRSHLINAFLRRYHRLSSSRRTSKSTPFPRLPPSPWAGSVSKGPVGRSSSFTVNSVHPPRCFLSLVVGADSWLKKDPGILVLTEGVGGNVHGKPEAESCDVSDLHDPEDPGSRSPRGQYTWGHSAVSPLFWLSLLGVCCRPPWGARALHGPLALP